MDLDPLREETLATALTAAAQDGATAFGLHAGTEAERLDAVKLALEVGNDVNAQADFGNYPVVGEPSYTLLYYPLNMDEIRDKVLGDPRWNGSTPLIGAVTRLEPVPQLLTATPIAICMVMVTRVAMSPGVATCMPVLIRPPALPMVMNG